MEWLSAKDFQPELITDIIYWRVTVNICQWGMR